MTSGGPIHRLPEGALRLARGILHPALPVEDHGAAMRAVVGGPVGSAPLRGPTGPREGDPGVLHARGEGERLRAPADERTEQPMLEAAEDERQLERVAGAE